MKDFVSQHGASPIPATGSMALGTILNSRTLIRRDSRLQDWPMDLGILSWKAEITSFVWVSRQHRNETYSEVAKKVEFVQRVVAQPSPSMHNTDFLAWFNRCYVIQDGGVHIRASSRLRASLNEPMYLEPSRRGLSRCHVIHLCQRCVMCVKTSLKQVAPWDAFAVPVGTADV